MAIVLSVPQQSYGAGTRSFTPNVTAGATEFSISFTRVAWPAGNVMNVTILYPDGSSAGGAGFAGGVLIGRDGNPMLVSRVGIRAKVATLPAGQYTVTTEVLQTLTTAVTVDRV